MNVKRRSIDAGNVAATQKDRLQSRAAQRELLIEVTVDERDRKVDCRPREIEDSGDARPDHANARARNAPGGIAPCQQRPHNGAGKGSLLGSSKLGTALLNVGGKGSIIRSNYLGSTGSIIRSNYVGGTALLIGPVRGTNSLISRRIDWVGVGDRDWTIDRRLDCAEVGDSSFR